MTYQERLEEYTTILDEYEKSVGLHIPIYNKEVEPILLFNYDQLKNLDQHGCEQYAFLLNQYSLILTKEINRNRAKLNWAEKQLDLLIANQYNNYAGDKFVKYELVKNRVILGDEAAKVLQKIIVGLEGKVKTLEDVSSKIDFMSRTLSNLARSKNGR